MAKKKKKPEPKQTMRFSTVVGGSSLMTDLLDRIRELQEAVLDTNPGKVAPLRQIEFECDKDQKCCRLKFPEGGDRFTAKPGEYISIHPHGQEVILRFRQGKRAPFADAKGSTYVVGRHTFYQIMGRPGDYSFSAECSDCKKPCPKQLSDPVIIVEDDN